MEKKAVRLRASCNACNESKVRCSQTKPTCARCERNKTPCVYGLSRRIHKDAPPISVSQSSSRRSFTQIPGSTGTPTPTAAAVERNTGDYTDGTTLMPAVENHILSPEQTINNFFEQSFPAPCAGTGTGTGLSLSPNLDVPSFISRLPKPSEDQTTSLFSSLGSFAPLGTTPTTTPGHSTDIYPQPPAQPLQPPACNCHAGVMEQLASMSHTTCSDSQGERLSVDVQLSQLKRCIIASEISMGCNHGRADSEPINIMAMAVLVGRIIDEFEITFDERCSSKLPRSSLSLDEVVSGAASEPKLSWGVLELEDDDEIELRQRLYLLYFRKLERLLGQLNLFVRGLHEVRGGSCSATFVMACEYIHLWLEKKVEGVKELFYVDVRAS